MDNISHISIAKSWGETYTWDVVINGHEYYGTIGFPEDERAPTNMDWDSEVPENWEDIEDLIITKTFNIRNIP